MELHETREIYDSLLKSHNQPLVKSMVNSAIRYSQLRVAWLLSSQEERNELEEERSSAHNAFISACDILSRNMYNSKEDNSWRNRIGKNRKDIGDFACLLNAVLGINAR